MSGDQFETLKSVLDDNNINKFELAIDWGGADQVEIDLPITLKKQ